MAASNSGATRGHNAKTGGAVFRGLRPNHRHQLRRLDLPTSFRHATAVTWNNQPASTVFVRSLRARRASTRKTARVTSSALPALPVRRYAEE